jgi:hypothetical protein
VSQHKRQNFVALGGAPLGDTDRRAVRPQGDGLLNLRPGVDFRRGVEVREYRGISEFLRARLPSVRHLPTGGRA